MNYLSWLKKYLQQSWESLTEDWQVLREAPIPASELNQTFLQASLPGLNFYLLLALAVLSQQVEKDRITWGLSDFLDSNPQERINEFL